MAQREYKQLSCRDLGAECDFLVRSEKGDEVMSLVREHACRIHNRCENTPELKDRMRVSMKTICCEGGCYQAPRMTGQSCWDSF
jgi:predicted small metal-binding protein